MDPAQEPANLRFLRRLVTGLTAIMIMGVLTIIVLLVIRLNATPSAVQLPDTLTLPDGTKPTAFTLGPDWLAVITDDEILIYNLDGSLRKRVSIDQ
ncbi:MAG: DUF6476 family protein [Pseudomonadota bacterium]